MSCSLRVLTLLLFEVGRCTHRQQFLKNLLHQSLHQEDAIDQFDGPYHTVNSSIGVPALETSGLESLSKTCPPAISLTPEPTAQPSNILLIVPGTSNASQPVDFAQVFGKLSSAADLTPAILSSGAVVNKVFVKRLATVQENQDGSTQPQLASTSNVLIKIDQTTENMKLPPEINSNDIYTNSVGGFRLAFTLKEGDILKAVSPTPNVGIDSLSVPLDCNFGKLKDIQVEPPKKEEDFGEQLNISNIGGESVTQVAGAEGMQIDPTVILSQAVSLQKELFEEPALDGIPASGTSLNTGVGFAKGITLTSPAAISLKGFIADSLQNSSLSAGTLVAGVAQQQVLEPQHTIKLMQLPENVRMSPDSTDPGVTVSTTIPFSTHHITSNVSTSTITAMGVSPNSPSSTTSAGSSSPIPMKRSRFSFPHPTSSKGTGLKLRNQNYMPARSVGKRLPPGTTPTLTSNLAPCARDGRVQLQIVSQPEEQHRARYQTEGSRGAIKDRKGNGFPTVKLVGYDKPSTLQIFIGTDQGKVSPHMFYQACKVTGKSSTPCIEKKVEGTILIEIEFEPSKDMVISCDCVGILKERNVDVEQRFPFHHASQSRKKSTKCRMIFRTTIMNSDGMEETLQVASVPILCTQPPGVPEICKQSLTECPAKGGLELFVIGKNFLKDTRIVFQEEDGEGHTIWEVSSEPLKDYLQQNHLVCSVPAFKDEKIMEPVECKLMVVSGGKHSEPHRFTYLPEGINAHLGLPSALSTCTQQQQQIASPIMPVSLVQQIQNAQSLLPVELQTVNVNTMLQPVTEAELVKSVIATSPGSACSPVSITSPGNASMCSSGSLEGQTMNQPSPPVTTALNPLSSLGFASESLIQTVPVTETQAVSNFQAALQQAVQQQVQQQVQQAEAKTVAQLLESMKPSAATVTSAGFPVLAIQEQKPVVTNAIPLDLQFPTQDLPPVTSTPPVTLSNTSAEMSPQLSGFPVQNPSPITTVSNPFQQTAAQMSCVNLPQIMSGIALNGAMPVTTTPPVMNAGVTVSSPQHQLSPTTKVVITTGNSNAPVSAMEVTDCLGQTIIKTEPRVTIENDLRLAIRNNVVSVTPTTLQPAAPPNPAVMGLLGGDLQVHQGSFANAISQMSDNELIDYINPNCFEGPLL